MPDIAKFRQALKEGHAKNSYKENVYVYKKMYVYYFIFLCMVYKKNIYMYIYK